MGEELIKEEELSAGRYLDLRNRKQTLEEELSGVNRNLRKRRRKYRDLCNRKRKYGAMQVLGVLTINKIGTERTMQVIEVSEGPVQLAGFQRNREKIPERRIVHQK